MKKIDAERILKNVDGWRRNLYECWDTERLIEIYANGGPPPSADDNCENDIVPLGFAAAHMTKEMAHLTDQLMVDPGFIHGTVIAPAIKDVDRVNQIESQVNQVVNEVVYDRLVPILTQFAGRATVTGRSCLFWLSPNDWLPKHGRMLHPATAGVDILDPDFREWAFDGKISLRNVEERIKTSSPNKHGWSYKGLTALKEWILASEAEKYSNSQTQIHEWAKRYDPATWAAVDISYTGFTEPVDVYWYYRKNGKITEDHPEFGGHEGVDLYCISRFGSQCKVAKTVQQEITYRELATNYPNKGKKYLNKLISDGKALGEEMETKDDPEELLLYYLPDAFKSIVEALVFHNDDASVSGEPIMNEVRGNGKLAMPKLAVMEGLLYNLIAGMSFASQLTWSVDAGVADEYLKQLQRGGLRHGQAFPAGIRTMEKQNSMVGFGPGMQAIQMLDNGIASDSTSGSQGVFGSSKADFAAQAQAQQSDHQRVASRRSKNFAMTLDKIAARVGRVICKHWPTVRKAHPSYFDTQRMRLKLKVRFGIHEDEWDADRWEFKARRLSGGLSKQESINVNTQLMMTVGPVMPALMVHFAKELLRAHLGDLQAELLTAKNATPDQGEVWAASMAVTVAFTTGTPPPVENGSNPMVHSGIAAKLAQDRTQTAMQAGMIAPAEQVGIMSVIQYAISHLMRIPQQVSEPAIDQMTMLAKTVQSIPVQTPPEEGAMTEKERADVALKAQNYNRLEVMDEEKIRLARNKENIALRELSNKERNQDEQEKTLAANRAKTHVDIQNSLMEQNAQPAPAPSLI